MKKILTIICASAVIGLILNVPTRQSHYSNINDNKTGTEEFSIGYQPKERLNLNETEEEQGLSIDFKAIKSKIKTSKIKLPGFKPGQQFKGITTDTEAEIYVPLFLQTDERWGNIKVGNTDLADGGCGIVSLCMVSSAFGNIVLPSEEIASRFEKYYINGVGLSWDSMTQGAKDVLKLNGEKLNSVSATELEEKLNENIAVVSFKPGKFTTSGHFAVITKSNEKGKVKVYDPNDSETKLFKYQLWDIEFIIKETKGIWIYSGVDIQE